MKKQRQKPSNFSATSYGTWVAPSIGVGLLRALRGLCVPALTMLSPLIHGCLITDPIDIPEEQEFPPSIVSDLAAPEPRYPIEETVTLDRDVDTELTFSVIVQDPNFDQPLDYVVYRNYDPTAVVVERVDEGPVEITEELRRPLSFTIDNLVRFTRGECHKIELRVSSDFQLNAYDPTTPGDIAVAVWWVNSLSDDGTPTDLATCPD